MQVADFDFHLPEEAIAQRPAPRGTAKLLHLDRFTGALRHLSASDLPSLLRPGDVLVVNDTKVIPARLVGLDETGRRLEILLVRRLADTTQETWECLAKPGRH
ncbi:MAG: S-adenosylmethionine:tRNA ribosyltransferase-isomerase, partial [Acidobacteria bacterium]|nr:S-adenosylmethionine:tRNA ribosyltransferase-isomerase [Acidobacteriota bacterium]